MRRSLKYLPRHDYTVIPDGSRWKGQVVTKRNLVSGRTWTDNTLFVEAFAEMLTEAPAT